MHSTLNKRLLLSILYLGAMFLVAGTLFYTAQYFSGTVFLPGNSPESLAFRPGEGGRGLGLAQRDVPPDLLLLDNPGVVRVLRRDARYDAIVLPFALRMDSATMGKAPEPVHTLTIESPETSRTVTIAEGSAVPIAGESRRVAHIGPWDGLLASATGQPMAVVVLGGEALWAGPTLFLESGQWQIPAPNLAILFHWYPNEAAARADVATSLAEVTFARWGVREGPAIQWFENLVAGNGATLRDGTQVRLLEARPDAGWISLEVRHGESAETVRVEANGRDANAAYRFESPAAAGRAVMLYAWREDHVVCRVLARDRTLEERVLAPGEGWVLPTDNMPLWISQIRASAVTVRGGQVSAAYLQMGERTLAVREGLVETIGDDRVRYQKEQAPAPGRYTISALEPGGKVIRSAALGEGDRVRIGAWVIGLADENPFAPAGIALTAVRRPGGLAQMLGLGLFLAGSFGLVVTRFKGGGTGRRRGASE